MPHHLPVDMGYWGKIQIAVENLAVLLMTHEIK